MGNCLFGGDMILGIENPEGFQIKILLGLINKLSKHTE
jgi:hypothetical protein